MDSDHLYNFPPFSNTFPIAVLHLGVLFCLFLFYCLNLSCVVYHHIQLQVGIQTQSQSTSNRIFLCVDSFELTESE